GERRRARRLPAARPPLFAAAAVVAGARPEPFGGLLRRRARLPAEPVEGIPDLPGVCDAEEQVLLAGLGVGEPCGLDAAGAQLGLDGRLDAVIALDPPELGHVELRPLGGLLPRGALRRL